MPPLIAPYTNLQRNSITGNKGCALLAAVALLAGCGERNGTFGSGAGDDSRTPVSCEIDAQLTWVDDNMRDYYLFYDQVPNPRLSDFDTPERLIQALRVPPDRFSFVADAATSAAFFEEGKDFGYGWRLDRREDGALVTTLIEPGSPLDVAGVRRGEIIRSIGGVEEASITSNEQYDQLLGTGTDVLTVELDIEALDGTLRTVSVTRGEFDVSAVLDVDVREVAGARVGYLSFLTFTETSRAELDQAFAQLSEANVTELVLDLRFNGGGRIDVANQLASRIIGEAAGDSDFVRYRVNDRYQNATPESALRNRFQQLDDSLDLSRLYVLSSDRTCSASEMIINGLSPLIDVVTIGTATCGKPYGFRGRERCGKVMQAVEFEFVNDAGVGGYVNGLPVDCEVIDDVSLALGDSNERLLSAALQHIETATCPLPTELASSPASTLRSGKRSSDGKWTHANPTDPTANSIPAR